MFAVRESGWGVISIFLLLQAILIVVLVHYSPQIFIPIAQKTQWILHPDLLFAATLFLIVIVGILFVYGRLKPVDIGLHFPQIPVALLITAGLWVITQTSLILTSLIVTGTVETHSDWSQPGVIANLGFFAAMLLGMATYEEVAFRGYLFPQLYKKFGGSHNLRLLYAAVVSSFLFAIVHIPTRIINAQMSVDELFVQMAILTVAGLIGVALYVRTQNLFVVIGIHALINAPLPLVHSPVSPFIITSVLSGILWIIWPYLQIKTPSKFT
ncbi:CPBP family intramembrane metalloprotease [Rhodohalobacter sp. SW132]|uniref:CPBP family intramembrane glutamic endopeptidase n=1 Tax=Rhodohalobacter sp. SW132 TaxID=2293433 RepID=UPI000E24BD13|nr:type II CAAX endopeptidase family protein [Rhodohalobacter sp. SW132]REL37939.1 CPBP family intramembrane metalloprotease [Rhodohalobacter sp. SW132]